MLPSGGRHGRIAMKLAASISNHVEAHGLGTVVAAETGFLLTRDPDTVRAPDVGFIGADRAAAADTAGFIPGAPDLAVEVLSPDDRPGYVSDKVAEWIEAGSRSVWVVDPRSRTVIVHEPEREPRLLDEADTLFGGDLLPGLELDVRRIFT